MGFDQYLEWLSDLSDFTAPHLRQDLPFFSADTCFGKLLFPLFESLFRPLVFYRRPALEVSPDLGIRFHHFRCLSTVTRKQMSLLTQRQKVSGNPRSVPAAPSPPSLHLLAGASPEEG